MIDGETRNPLSAAALGEQEAESENFDSPAQIAAGVFAPDPDPAEGDKTRAASVGGGIPIPKAEN
jgi:hypothetical protein